MIQIEEMNNAEAMKLIERVGYGHLGCSHDNIPYVVPIHYAVLDSVVYFYTTEGRKYEIIRENPNVCLQIEDVREREDWESVMVTGTAVEILHGKERDDAFAAIKKRNPWLTPALGIRWMDDWIRENREVIYRLDAASITGRYSVKLNTRAAFAKPLDTRSNKNN